MRIPKKVFILVCRLCQNSRKWDDCPSNICPLSVLRINPSVKGSVGLMKKICRSCDSFGYIRHVPCKTVGGCPLENYYNSLWAKPSR